MKFYLTLLCSLFSLALFAQTDSKSTPYDGFIKRFNQKMDTVFWLCRYDAIAWWTSDSVAASPKEEQAKLGSEWFCYPENDSWHALYGKFTNGNFQLVYHYFVDTANKITRIQSPVDTTNTNSLARSIVNGNLLLNAYPDTLKVRCNQYVKKNDDGSISIWFLPAFTQNGIAVYGGEFYYQFDKTGNNLTSKSEYSQQYLGFKPDSKKQITLNYPNLKEPSLGGIFFAWYYKDYFDRITINTQTFASTPIRNEPGNYTWLHAAKDK